MADQGVSEFVKFIPTFGVAGTIFLTGIYAIHKGWFRPQREIENQRIAYEEQIKIIKENCSSEIKEIRDSVKLQLELKDAIFSEMKEKYELIIRDKNELLTAQVAQTEEWKGMTIEQFQIAAQAVKTAQVATNTLSNDRQT